ncbi:FUSC family protein [Corynebacterium lactis]|uniref:Membrane protein n=1 Tax=Corynebacterium lactis RW2-5 TaxID=1408189 RepID=A0A0K2H262_9CORY|nr:FUSC family protein [Corynebacterium lactis]ALA68140.1 membrane protein [Corynebacterium lactis RW2-5]
MEPDNPRPDFLDFRQAYLHPASRAAHAVRRRMRPRTRFLHAANRVKSRWMLIIQATLAAGIAYWVALSVLNHPNPFFAPMAAFISLNVMTAGPRIKHSMELVLGASLGVGVGDVIISILGPGTWQLTIGVFVAMVIGVFIGRGPLVVNQAASSAVLIATIIPPGTAGTYHRMIDALVGGVIGIFVLVVLPRNPLAGARRKIAEVLDMGADSLYDIGIGMREADTERIRTALSVVRSMQTKVSLMDGTVADAAEQVRISPLLWRSRKEIQSLSRVVHPVDNAMRNIRVLARRAITAREDHIQFDSRLCDLVVGVSEAARFVGLLLDNEAAIRKIPTWGELPYESAVTQSSDKEATATSPVELGVAEDLAGLEDIVRYLRRLSARMHPNVVEGATLSEQVVFAQCRSLMVDLLQVCGLSRLSAVATLPPTTEYPAMPPEVWDE